MTLHYIARLIDKINEVKSLLESRNEIRVTVEYGENKVKLSYSL